MRSNFLLLIAIAHRERAQLAPAPANLRALWFTNCEQDAAQGKMDEAHRIGQCCSAGREGECPQSPAGAACGGGAGFPPDKKRENERERQISQLAKQTRLFSHNSTSSSSCCWCGPPSLTGRCRHRASFCVVVVAQAARRRFHCCHPIALRRPGRPRAHTLTHAQTNRQTGGQTDPGAMAPPVADLQANVAKSERAGAPRRVSGSGGGQ